MWPARAAAGDAEISSERCGHTSCGSVTKHASRVIAMDWEGLTEQPSGMATGGLAQEAS